MANHCSIEWTEATWNPIAGCSVVSPGCTNCYAMRRVAPRLAANPATPHYAGTIEMSKAGPFWTGRIGLASDKVLTAPLRWKKPRMIFVNSTSDLFHEAVPDEVIDRIFAVTALCPRHTFQVLTKRSARMRAYLSDRASECRILLQAVPADWKTSGKDRWGHLRYDRTADTWHLPWPLPNVWLGVSAEDQRRADERIPDLLATPATVRFVSAEPLLGPINLTDAIWAGHDPAARYLTETIDWIIVGGESGSDARPMHPDWARSIRDQCTAAGVPFFFKQWGEWVPQVGAVDGWTIDDDPEISRFDHRDWETDHWGEPYRPMWCDDREDDTVSRVGKKRAGRLLDGVEHNAMPQVSR